MDFQKFLVEEIDKLIDEMSSTAGAPGYETPKAFGGTKKARKKNSEVFGLKTVRDLEK